MSDVVTCQVVYTGRRTLAKGGMGQSFMLLTDPLEEARMFSLKVKAVAVGGIYEIDAPDADCNSVYPESCRFTGQMYDDEEARLDWQVRDQLARGLEAAAKAERGIARRTDLDALLAPLEATIARMHNRHDATAFRRLVSERLDVAYWKARS